MSDKTTKVFSVRHDPAAVVNALPADADGRLTVTWAGSLQAAPAPLCRAATELVSLDFRLSDSAGLDTLLKFRASAPGVALVPLTGTDDQVLALESHADQRARISFQKLSQARTAPTGAGAVSCAGARVAGQQADD